MLFEKRVNQNVLGRRIFLLPYMQTKMFKIQLFTQNLLVKQNIRVFYAVIHHLL